MAQWLRCVSATSYWANSNTSRSITFTFGVMPLRKVWTPVYLPDWQLIVPLLFFYNNGFGIEKCWRGISCLNFWDEAWFLSLRVFGLLSSSSLLFPQSFGRYVLRPSSGVCRIREPSRNFELHPLLNPRGSPVLKVEIIDGAEHWRIRRLKESAHMLGYNDLLSRPSIEMNTIWELIIKMV